MRANEQLYKTILAEIRTLRPNFNIGVSTKCTLEERWSTPYRHWCFRSYAAEYQADLTKRGKGKREEQNSEGKQAKKKRPHLAYMNLPRTQREASAQTGSLVNAYCCRFGLLSQP